MRYYRCKCGSRVSWSSMGVSRCSGCSKCGSDLAEGPELHQPVQPHKWVNNDADSPPMDSLTKEEQVYYEMLGNQFCLWCNKSRQDVDG